MNTFDPSLGFTIANATVALAWLALCFSPAKARWATTVWRTCGRYIPLAFGFCYVLLLVNFWPTGGGFNSLEQVQILFKEPSALLAGWIHYLAFDLFVGVWIAQRCAILKIKHWIVVVLLIATFMFGPLGLIGYALLSKLPRYHAAGDALVRQLFQRNSMLTGFAVFWLVALIPALIAMGFDPTQLRGVNIWIKPTKFMASIAIFSLTTVWFLGALPVAQQKLRNVRIMSWVIVFAASYEVAYICLQAGFGQASHYNYTDALHGALYGLMGLGAVCLTATHGWLAWRVLRSTGTFSNLPIWPLTVGIGLATTFVLGTLSGAVLSAIEPPSTIGLPLLGWHFSGGDFRPAHFIGMHAEQIIPLAGLVLIQSRFSQARKRKFIFAITGFYALIWLLAMLLGLR